MVRTCFELLVCPQSTRHGPRVGQACGLNENVVKGSLLQHETLQRVDEVILDRTAEAPIREFYPLVHFLVLPCTQLVVSLARVLWCTMLRRNSGWVAGQPALAPWR